MTDWFEHGFADLPDAPHSPVVDRERLAEIQRLGLLDPWVDDALRDLVRDAADQLGLSQGTASVVLSDAQLVRASVGITGWLAEVGAVPVEWSFCANSVVSRDAFVVEDAATHPVVRDNPLVRLEGVRCYAGMPLITSTGFVLGNLCVFGTEARAFDENDLATLRRLAAEAVRRIEAREGAPGAA